jgi:hypothetical protein
MNGPFDCPWLTFAAVLVALGAGVAAVVWAVLVRFKE